MPTIVKRCGLTRIETLVVLAIIGLACGLRCERLALPPLSSDEAFSWRLTTYSVAELLHHMPGDAHPPLYYLLLKGWIVLFGDSPFTLRSLSVLFALASIVVLYALCREAAARFCSATSSSFSSHSGALFAASLLALHLAAVDEPSRNARMYSQGIFLAGLTAWLLLRALRCPRGGLGWWLGYGLAVAAFCYTHYYAFFTVAAQTVFVAGDLALRAWKNSASTVRASFTGFVLAATLAFLLYIPWFPVWWKQIHDVRQGFWIAPVTWAHAKEVFFSWSTGLPYGNTSDFTGWVVFVLTCIVWIIGKADRGGLFLLVLVSIPWVLSLSLSAWSERPIFHERYLLFAQFFLIAFWGVVWDRLPAPLPRLGLGCFLCALSLSGMIAARERWPTRSPPLAAATAFLHDHYQTADRVLTSSPSALNRLRYYTAQTGMLPIWVRCRLSPFQPSGHVVHVGSLQAEDVLWDGLASEVNPGRRVWTLTESSAGASLPGNGWREVSRWHFGGGSEGHYYLILHECSRNAARPGETKSSVNCDTLQGLFKVLLGRA